MIFEKCGFSVWITDGNGDKLPEYQVEETSHDTIQCWIPSTEGNNFEIHFKVSKNPNPKYALSTTPFLDGVEMAGSFASKSELKDSSWSGIHSSELIGTSTARLYGFGRRTLTDSDDSLELDESLLDSLNTIKLVFEWGRLGRSSRVKISPPREIGPIHEKLAKKGHSSAVKLGKTISVPPVSDARSFYVREEIDPVKFVFHYAADDWLQARGIIQRSPLPEPNSTRNARKRAHSTPEVVDADELEIDDEIQIIKHLIPAPVNGNKKRRTSGQEEVSKPKKEED